MSRDDTTLEARESLRFDQREAPSKLRAIRVLPGPTKELVTIEGDRSRSTLGRSAESADVELEDDRISRAHLELALSKGVATARDLSSKNGSWIDGAPLDASSPATLSDGSVLRLGDTLLVVRFGEAPPDPTDRMTSLLPGLAPAMIAARRALRLLATETETGPVLLLGETGTGKEYAAQALAIEGAPFVPVNCAELVSGLARAELFGSEKGAFTDAAARPGLIASAHGGVIFWDEIGDLELAVQAELLRFLEDGRYRRVGGSELLHSSARVVAATNVDLDAAVAAGQFRRDLLGRLRSHARPIRLPPLRERREDILDWARRFADVSFSTGFAESLLIHPWPENLRELSGVVKTAAREAQGEMLHVEALRGLLERRENEPAGGARSEHRVAALDRESIEAALIASGGNVRAAADNLGLERTKMYRMIKSFGFDADSYRKT